MCKYLTERHRAAQDDRVHANVRLFYILCHIYIVAGMRGTSGRFGWHLFGRALVQRRCGTQRGLKLESKDLRAVIRAWP